MEGSGPSQTALHVAAAREAHRRFDGAAFLDDPQALDLLGPDGESLVATYGDEGGSWLLHENRLFIPFRARYVEDRLDAAHARGARQLVILGAGLDSYAFRRPAHHGDVQVFEVDHPNTQRWKIERIEALGWDTPDTLCFVPCDFETTAISEALRKTHFDTEQPAIVSWMGVTYYLEAETTASALRDLHSVLAPGSEVVFDYQFPFEDFPERYQALRESMASYLRGVGEPHVNRYRPDALREVILGAGYPDAVLEDPAAIRQRYFAPLDTNIAMSERFGIAAALR